MINMEHFRELIADAMTCRRCDEIAGMLSELQPENQEETRKLAALQKATKRKHDFWHSNPFDLLDQSVDDYIREKYDLPPPESKRESKPLADEKRLKRNAYMREYQRKRRANETPEQRQHRLANAKKYKAKQMENETPEHRRQRLAAMKGYKERRKITETSKQRRKRLADNREYMRAYFQHKHQTDPDFIESRREYARIYTRNRYQNDPAYRERKKAQSRQYYSQHKEAASCA